MCSNVATQPQYQCEALLEEHCTYPPVQVLGTNYWPFRTEEEVQMLAFKSNERQKMLLEAQLREQRERKEHQKRVLRHELLKEQVHSIEWA